MLKNKKLDDQQLNDVNGGTVILANKASKDTNDSTNNLMTSKTKKSNKVKKSVTIGKLANTLLNNDKSL